MRWVVGLLMAFTVVFVVRTATGELPIPPDWDVLYITDFCGTESVWLQEEQSSCVFGEYQLRATEGELYLIPLPASLAVRDLAVELDVGGLDGVGELGIYSRREGILSFLSFTVSSDGSLVFRRMEYGAWVRNVEIQDPLFYSGSISNLGILVQSESVSFYLNKEFLAEAKEDVLVNPGEVGILFWRKGDGTVTGQLRRLTVWGNWREVGPSAPWWPTDYPRIIALYEEKLAALRTDMDRVGEGECLRYLAASYFDLGDYRRAIEYYEQSLALSRAIDDPSAESESLSGLGMCYYLLGDLRQAADFLQRALAAASQDIDTGVDAVALMVLGEIRASQQEYGPAYGYTMEALADFRDAGNQQGEARCLADLGNWYASFMEDYYNAINYGERDRVVFRV